MLLMISPLVFAADLRIATWNMEWFFDADEGDNSGPGTENSAPDAAEFHARVNTFADAIKILDPTILAVQEIEHARVLQALVDRLRTHHNLGYQIAFVEGTDTATQQDVAFLVKDGLPIIFRRFVFERANDPNFKDLSKHLALEVQTHGEPLLLVTVHLRAGSAVQERQRQARTLHEWIGARVATDNVIILGDFNTSLAVQETTPGSEMGIIRGFQSASQVDDLFDVHTTLSAADRPTHASGRQFDRVLISPALQDDTGLRFITASTHRTLAIRGTLDNTSGVDYALPEAEQDLSDHFPLLAVFASGAQPGGGGTVRREQLLQAIARIEQQLQQLREEVAEVKILVEQLDE
jgi:endonuclease/exonuclease/phosphatase family metal-dependent hydrolase